MKRCNVACFGLVVLAAMIGSGCLFDSTWEPPEPWLPPPPPAFPFPGSEDQVIANLKTAYTSMRIDDYRSVLSPQYAFLLRPQEVRPGESDRLTFAQELVAAENMFSGQPIQHAGSTPVPAISSISISVLNRVAAWSDVDSSDHDFPNTRRGLYEVQLSFARAGANTIIVNGQQEFYVVSRDSLVAGETRQYFLLRGQRDLTNGAKIEVDSWGSVKNLYR